MTFFSKYSHSSNIQYYSNMQEPYLETVVFNDGCRLESFVKLCENAGTQALLSSPSNSKNPRWYPGSSSFKSFTGDSDTQPWLMMSCHRLKCLGSWVGNLNQ